MVINTEVSICIENKIYSFYYSYNNNSNFLDLLEYISYLLPELGICQCFKFQINNNDNNYIQIENNYQINKYSGNLSNLELIDKKKKKFCRHNLTNYLKYSKSKITSLFEENINNLKNNNNKQIEKIKNLNQEKKELEMKVNELNKENKELEKNINYLIKEYKELEIKMNNLNNEDKELDLKINILNKDKNCLESVINEDIEKINFLNQLGREGDNLKKSDGIIQVNSISNKIKSHKKYKKEKIIDFYDIIIHIKGWKIEFNEKTKENYKSFKNQKMIKIGVIGNSIKGKSFLLSKISKIQLPYGRRTEGLSIKYPDLGKFKDRKIALLDSEGIETPVLNLSNQNTFSDDKINELFREKAKEKLITQLFLQNYIINNSDVLIVVVGIINHYLSFII